MNGGIEVFSNGKTLQISTDYIPACLRKSGKLTSSTIWYYSAWVGIGGSTTPTSGSSSWSDPIDVSDYTSPMVFFKSTVLTSRVSIFISYDKKLYFLKWWNFSITGDIEYYIFDTWTPSERSSSGLQVYNPTTKQIVFDSGWYLMNIVQLHQIPVNAPALEWGSNYAYEIELGISTNIAVGLSSYREIWIDSGSGGSGGVNDTVGWFLRDCAWIEGTKAKISYVISIVDNTSYDSRSSRWHNKDVTYLYAIDTTRLPNPYG